MESNVKPALKFLDVPEAVMEARKYLQRLQSLDLIGNVADVRLEEVELSPNRQYWLVTLGFNYKIDTDQNLLESYSVNQYERQYKIFQVNTANGEVESMKIWVL